METLYPTIIVEGDSLVREGLRLLLEKTPFSPQVCVADLGELNSIDDNAVVIFVIREKDSAGDQAAEMRRRLPNAKLVAIADEARSECLAQALETGANAAFLTSITPDGLVNSLRALVIDDVMVVDAKVWLTAPAAASLKAGSAAEADRAADRLSLSVREADILARIVQGDSNKHIARHFDIAEATVKAHMKAILRKIGAANRTQAAIWAMNNGLGPSQGGAEADAEEADGIRGRELERTAAAGL